MTRLKLLNKLSPVHTATSVARRALLALAMGAGLAAVGCAQGPGASQAGTSTATPSALGTGQQKPPIVFLHGNGDTASQWQTMVWRFESNGWSPDRLFALRHPYPLARTSDEAEQEGRTSTAQHMAFLSEEVDRVLKTTGADKVVLMANSRGGNAVRNYILRGGGAQKVSHAILGGTPNHGIHAIPGFLDGSEFSGLSPFLKQLNEPKNAAGDEVTGPVQWMTLRSDTNDRYAQPDGRWIGKPGQPTNVGYDSPALKGAQNVVLPGADHREVSYSAEAFGHAYRFITGEAPRTTDIDPEAKVILRGMATGLGRDSLDPQSGNYVNNLPVPGARVEVYAVDENTAERQGAALLDQVVGHDGVWGPVEVPSGKPVELVVSAPGYATTHYYRSGFPRSSRFVDLRAARLPIADAHAPSVVILWRPRGYLDPARHMQLDGAPPPGVPAGAAVAWSKIKPEGPVRPIVAEFESERVVGRNWPAGEEHMVYLELTH